MQELFIPLSLTLGLLVFSLINKWYLSPLLGRLPLREALTPLLLLHSLRYIGLGFLVSGVTASPLDPLFAEPAAYGDLLASLLALIALVAVRFSTPGAIALVWVFNIVGSLDLLNALLQGLQRTEPTQMGSTYFIPVLIVPALLATHYLVFKLLVGRHTFGTPANKQTKD